MAYDSPKGGHVVTIQNIKTILQNIIQYLIETLFYLTLSMFIQLHLCYFKDSNSIGTLLPTAKFSQLLNLQAL